MSKMVDLPRARAAREALRRAVAACPTARTAAFLAGELPGDLETPPMANKLVKLPEEMVARAEALLPRLADTVEMQTAGRQSAAAVIRLACAIGLAELEARTAGKTAPKTKRRK